MKTITLNILAEDIKTTDYTNSDKCAITRALRRAGLGAHEGGGGEIWHDSYGSYIKTPVQLCNKVRSMYKSLDPEKWIGPTDSNLPCIEPQDFTYSLEIPNNW